MTEAVNLSIVLRGANYDRETVKLNVFVIGAVGGFRSRRVVEKTISLIYRLAFGTEEGGCPRRGAPPPKRREPFILIGFPSYDEKPPHKIVALNHLTNSVVCVIIALQCNLRTPNK